MPLPNAESRPHGKGAASRITVWRPALLKSNRCGNRGCLATSVRAGVCPWHHAISPERYIDVLMRHKPGDTARGGGWQFRAGDGTWRTQEPSPEMGVAS